MPLLCLGYNSFVLGLNPEKSIIKIRDFSDALQNKKTTSCFAEMRNDPEPHTSLWYLGAGAVVL